MQSVTIPGLGASIGISVYDSADTEAFERMAKEAGAFVTAFEGRYSRFKSDSEVRQLAERLGVAEVSRDLVAMLRVYETLSKATNGKITPTVGGALSSVGYDERYTLRQTGEVSRAPAFRDAMRIVDETHLELYEPVTLDLGALGKGYLVDRLCDLVSGFGFKRFLVNGSGDVRYENSESQPISCGLEHPHDPRQVIGVLPLMHGALCASATNRRAWGDRSHYLDPETGESPERIIATWVTASHAVVADALATSLFFVEPDLLTDFTFDYLILRDDLRTKKSAGFAADLFTS